MGALVTRTHGASLGHQTVEKISVGLLARVPVLRTFNIEPVHNTQSINCGQIEGLWSLPDHAELGTTSTKAVDGVSHLLSGVTASRAREAKAQLEHKIRGFKPQILTCSHRHEPYLLGKEKLEQVNHDYDRIKYAPPAQALLMKHG